VVVRFLQLPAFDTVFSAFFYSLFYLVQLETPKTVSLFFTSNMGVVSQQSIHNLFSFYAKYYDATSKREDEEVSPLLSVLPPSSFFHVSQTHHPLLSALRSTTELQYDLRKGLSHSNDSKPSWYVLIFFLSPSFLPLRILYLVLT
jgi:hypothetical protein